MTPPGESHRLLARQMRRLGLRQDVPPDAATWHRFLEKVSLAYHEADDERYLWERSLGLSSRELQDLNASLRASEARLAGERDKLQAIICSLGDGLCVLDIDGNGVLLNPEAERLLGWRHEELVGQPVLGIVCVGGVIAPAAEGFRSERMRMRRKDGSTFAAAVVLDPILRDSVRTGSVLVLRDITALEVARESLEKEHRQLQMLINSAPIEMAMFDREMRYIAHSERWRTDFALTGDLLGRSHYEVFPDIPQRWKDLHARAQGGETLTCAEDCFERADGSRLYVRWAIHPWQTPEGKIGGVVIVSDRVDDLVKAREAALEAASSKADFLANMSHEIRTPMTAILGFAERLADEDMPAEERRECEVVIKRNGEHLLAILNDILDLSKIEAGGFALEHAACSPAQIVIEVKSLLEQQALGKGLVLAFELSTWIPACIDSDPTRLRQILLNLVGNAIKFTEIGSVTIRVGLTDAVRPLLAFEVIDTGMGLSEAQRCRLFQPFTQADASTTRRFGGTGLGLAISRRLARALGGDIAVLSAVGCGSTFTLTIDPGDLGTTTLRAPGLLLQKSSSARPDGELARVCGRVLLVEDGRDNQRLITHVLKRAGATVTVAENGALGVEAALTAERSGRPFELVLMDMQMPIMDGYEATRVLRAQGYLRPIVALTAHAMSADRDRCLAAGCSEFATKPIDKGRLLGLLADVLAASRRVSAS